MRWNQTVKDNANYSKTIDDYIFTVPKTVNDVHSEASQQHNCLSSYVSRIISGKSKIYFMRNTDKPDNSYITIELNKDNELIQAKRACNKQPSDKDFQIINKWLATF